MCPKGWRVKMFWSTNEELCSCCTKAKQDKTLAFGFLWLLGLCLGGFIFGFHGTLNYISMLGLKDKPIANVSFQPAIEGQSQ